MAFPLNPGRGPNGRGRGSQRAQAYDRANEYLSYGLAQGANSRRQQSDLMGYNAGVPQKPGGREPGADDFGAIGAKAPFSQEAAKRKEYFGPFLERLQAFENRGASATAV